MTCSTVGTGVAAVHANGVKNLTARIVHFLDYHFVEQDDLASEFPHASAAEVASLHQEVLLKVELIQAEQLAALRSLVKHHGLSDVWSEGLTPEAVPAYLDTILRIKAGETMPVPKLELLKLGTASRAFISGHLKAVLPLDSENELDAAKTLEPAAVKARDAGIVQRLLKAKGTCQVIILGGSHDRTPHLPADVEYRRVAVLSYREVAGK